MTFILTAWKISDALQHHQRMRCIKKINTTEWDTKRQTVGKRSNSHTKNNSITYERLIMLEHKVNCKRADKVKMRRRPKSPMHFTASTPCTLLAHIHRIHMKKCRKMAQMMTLLTFYRKMEWTNARNVLHKSCHSERNREKKHCGRCGWIVSHCVVDFWSLVTPFDSKPNLLFWLFHVG